MVESVKDFYKGKSILVTGGTGFIGKVLIEKLLVTFPDIGNIYLIIKSRNGKSAKQRLNDMFKLPVFDRMRSKGFKCFGRKVIPLEGDISEKRLGLSEADYMRLLENVNVIFHVAANVKFNDPFHKVILANTRATLEVVKLACSMPNLKVFLYVSTAYSNCDRNEIEEVVYPPHADWTKTLSVAENIEPAILNILSKKYLGNLPNIYILSKSLAEQIVWYQSSRVPVVIVRPSIVVSSYAEPIPGWVENLNGPVGLLLASALGVIRISLVNSSIYPDFLPVDVLVNAMIVSTWHKGTSRGTKNIEHIYNAASAGRNISVAEMMELAVQYSMEYPTTKSLWHYSLDTTTNKLWFTINVWFKHLLPAIIIDTTLKLFKKKPILMDIQRKAYKAMMALHYFQSRTWVFHNLNGLRLYDNTLPDDKGDFEFLWKDMKPEEYLKVAFKGGRKYLLNESDEMIPAGRIRARRMKWLHKTMEGIFWLVLFWILFHFSIPKKMFYCMKENLLLF